MAGRRVRPQRPRGSKLADSPIIRLRGVRHNNLKNFDLDLPLHRLIVITGLSGSGKSSLAFDTLFAEGQRRYIETFSPYARQFFDRMDKPQVDSIEGIPPAIAIEQRNAVRTTRSTVGTMTEICDYMKMLWPHIAQLHCRQCGQPVRKDSPQRIWESVFEPQAGGTAQEAAPEALITFDLPLSEKLSLAESLALVAKQGYQRLQIAGRTVRLEEAEAQIAQLAPVAPKLDGVESPATRRTSRTTHHASRITSLTVIQDRLRLIESNRPRFIEACEQAYHFGKGKLAIHEPAADTSDSKLPPSAPRATEGKAQGLHSFSKGGKTQDSKLKTQNPKLFSNRLHCAQCDIEYREPSPALFSFNNPVGACPACRGFGRIISIDYDLALPDKSKTLAEGVVKPWQSGMSAECQSDLMRACRHFDIPTDVPFQKLPKKWQDFVIEGEPDYGKDEEHEWPRAWYGVKGYFRWLESKSYKMHVRVLLSRYRAYTRCPDCQGKRFQPEALLYRVPVAADLTRTAGASYCSSRSEEALTSRTPKDQRNLEPPHVGCCGVHEDFGCQSLTLADFYQLPVRDGLRFIEALAATKPTRPNDPLGLMLNEVRSRLVYLDQVGLGYLTLDRPTRSLSGGETERVTLTTCLGTRLVNTLFVLDEPSVGLHPRDTERLVQILEQLRDAGNTVVVVEHEASVMRSADQLVDLGPGHGATGGQVVFQGTYEQILKARQSLTGQYLSGTLRVEVPERRAISTCNGSAQRSELEVPALNEAAAPYGSIPDSAGIHAREFQDLGIRRRGCRRSQDQATPSLQLSHATLHNLNDLTVAIPLRRFVCVTGVSGSGKSTLVREVLLPALSERLKLDTGQTKASDRLEPNDNGENQESDDGSRIPHHASLEGWKHLERVILVDQSILGKTPRSNPAVYIGAFDDIREFFAQSEPAKQRGLNASAFSFNSGQGQCERCRGAGFEKIEMQFLSDIFIRCPACDGRRYRPHILEVKISPPSRITDHASPALSIADLLEATVEEAIEFLAAFPESRPAQRASQSLKWLEEVGLGYLHLGQPINTLSGGESQRLKLVRHLAEATLAQAVGQRSPTHPLPPSPTLFLFDEPTTGLHFDDVRVLLKVFQRLVDAGHSVLVIEHNLEVIKCADWIIDLGPEAGDQGGQVVAEGTPEDVMACPASHTGRALQQVLSGTSLGAPALARTRF